jgi:hypothetical protein
MSEATIEDDAISISSKCSTSSLSNEKIICNICKEELQQRIMFNHLRKKHESDFYFNIDIPNLKKAIKEQSYYEMDLVVPDERDETENVLMHLYCIFGKDRNTNKAFLKSWGATNYLKKKPDAIKEHLSQMNNLLKKKEDETKNKKPITRGCNAIQMLLKQAYHFISYSDHPLIMLENKEKDTSEKRERRDDLFKQFNVLVNSLPKNKNNVLTKDQQKGINSLFISSRGFFDGLVGWVDSVYDYPIWIDNMYYNCCTSDNPSGRRLGDNPDFMKYLIYPGDISETYPNDLTNLSNL